MVSTRPTEYTEELAARILDAVANGSNLNRVTAEEWSPIRQTVYKWLRINADFRDNYARAREDRADWRADKIDDICEKVETGELDPQAARVIIDSLKWQAGKEKPKVYGDKVTNVQTGPDGGPVVYKWED